MRYLFIWYQYWYLCFSCPYFYHLFLNQYAHQPISSAFKGSYGGITSTDFIMVKYSSLMHHKLCRRTLVQLLQANSQLNLAQIWKDSTRS